MASSLISHGLGTKKPYTVVNYYNQDPDKKVEEIKLPSNILTLCEGNATQICGQGMQSVSLIKIKTTYSQFSLKIKKSVFLHNTFYYSLNSFKTLKLTP